MPSLFFWMGVCLLIEEGSRSAVGHSCQNLPFSLALDVVLYGAQRGSNGPSDLTCPIGSGFMPKRQLPGRGSVLSL